MEMSLVNAMSREFTLRTYVNEVKKNYDTVLIDCMPSLGMITINIEAGVIPKFAACASQGVPWFQERGLWQDNSYEPRPGDIIYSYPVGYYEIYGYGTPAH